MNKKQINVAIIGTGWCGGIRAVAAASSPWVNELHIAEIKEDRLREVAEQSKPVTATTDYRKLLENKSIEAVIAASHHVSGTAWSLGKSLVSNFVRP